MLPTNIPVLATTATANKRVQYDIEKQLEGFKTIRGKLERESIYLQVMDFSTMTDKLAWLSENIPKIDGSGIIYALTAKDCEIISECLQNEGIDAHPYHSGIRFREELEEKLLKNEVKVLVATSSLGMGFDKPDLKFVIHFHVPGSVIKYYQEVGRAGRSLSNAYGILMRGDDDERINRYFIDSTYPRKGEIDSILSLLERCGGMKVRDISSKLNIREEKVKKILKFLGVEDLPAVVRNGKFFSRTSNVYVDDIKKREEIRNIRLEEMNKMNEYVSTDKCLMKFL
jgi:ATP-dependent DNA helicase RecQ